jgi:hypothetical protein
MQSLKASVQILIVTGYSILSTVENWFIFCPQLKGDIYFV